MGYACVFLGCAVAIGLVLCHWLVPFWSCLPMFHVYDLHRYICSGVIHHNHDTVKPNRWYYSSQTTTELWHPLSDEEKTTAWRLITEYYGTTAETFQTITRQQLESMLASSHSLVSFWNETEQYYDNASGWLRQIKPVATLFSHSYDMTLSHQPKTKVYYLDCLAISSTQTKQTLYSFLYSHLYNQYRISNQIKITCFKKEGQTLPGCRPCLQYFTKWYHLNDVVCYDNIEIKTTIVSNYQALQHVYDTPHEDMLHIEGDLPYVWKQVQEGRMWIGILWDMVEERPLSYYYVSRDWVEFPDGGFSLHLAATRTFCKITDELLMQGFNQIVCQIRENHTETKFTILKIDDGLLENPRIVRTIRKSPFKQIANSLYFYNYTTRSCFPPNRCFLFL